MGNDKCQCANPAFAIASIPIQPWAPPYDFDRALKIGTIFPELNKPIFCADDTAPPEGTSDFGKKSDSPSCLLKQIQEVSFALTDLSLYLDTHPDCDSGIALYQQTMKKRKALLEEFAKNYFPLNQDCIEESHCGGAQFCWTLGPAPWEGADAICSTMKKG